MHSSRRQLLLTFGLLSSLVSVFIAVLSLPLILPDTKDASDAQLALLYKVSQNEIPKLKTATATRAIYVDLDRMELSLADGGEVLRSIPILSRGKPGTFWETPTGNYRVETKEPNHFSSIGNVWMPYSMQFFGNFFIHGWPYHPDGTPVPTGYSGGCIRISTEDAAVVYAFAQKGTPIFVRGGERGDLATTTFQYFIKGEGQPPEISAGAFLVADADSGKVLWKRESTTTLPLRGLSALMSGVIALETVNQYKIVRMSELLLGHPIPRETTGKFADELPIGALIYPLMFEGNDTAAKAFASDHGEKSFVKNMNKKAMAIGLSSTKYASSTGVAANTGSAEDMFVLLRNIRQNKNFLLNASLQSEHVMHDPEGNTVLFQWENTFYQRASSTEYRGGLVTRKDGERGEGAVIYALPLAEFGERPIVIIVLDSKDPAQDILTIKDFVASHFVYAPDLNGVANIMPEDGEGPPSLWGKIRSMWKLEWTINQG